MRKSYYGLEPVDLRLICLRIRKKIGLFFIALLLGVLLGGLIYKVTTPKEQKVPVYQVTADYQITYAEEAPGVQYVYYSEYTWNTIVATEEFTQTVIDKVQDLSEIILSREEVLNYYTQVPMSDVRIVSIQTKSKDEALTRAISKGVEEAMLTLAKEWEDVDQIKILSSSSNIQKRYFDDYSIQAMFAGGGISLLVFSIAYCLYLLLDSSIFIPKTFELRYQIPVFGMLPKKGNLHQNDFLESIEYQILKAHLNQLMNHEGTVYFAGILNITTSEISEFLENNWKVSCIAPVTENIQELKLVLENDHIVLLIPFGKAKGQAMERTIELIHSMGKTIDGAILMDVEPEFMKQYYGREHTFREREKGTSL